METVRWGILSTAKIGREQVIPAIRQASNSTVTAISSRSSEKADKIARKLGINTSYSSYEELLADPDIDAIYNPLPNHLHVSKSIEALHQGKHVLCEKPIGLDEKEVRQLQKTSHRYPNLKVMEAFMYRFHPQWKKTKSLVKEGKIGKLQTIESFFSYYNDDPNNIRNKSDMGGGALMDIGCYCISLSRFLFEEEPRQIAGSWKLHPEFETDYLASGVLNFESGTSTFTCATLTAPHQRVTVIGTKGKIVIEIPFNALPDKKTTIRLYHDQKEETITFPPVNQYTLQTQEFANAILNNTEVPTPLDDAIKNMKTLDAFREQAVKG